jgi:type IV secretory pathway VirB3-like protein
LDRLDGHVAVVILVPVLLLADALVLRDQKFLHVPLLLVIKKGLGF